VKRILFLLVTLLGTPGVNAEELPATLRWAESSTLSTPLSGRIGVIKVEVGDRVKKNALLAALDPRPWQAEVKRAEADVSRLQAQLRIAERELRHATELYDRTVLSTTALEDAQARFDGLSAELKRAEAELELARLNIEYSQLRAPYAGIITERNIHAGETVSNRYVVTPMLRIARTDRLLAVARITPQQSRNLAVGQAVDVILDGERFTGKVRQIEANSSNPSLLVLKVSFTTASAVTPGQRAVLDIPQ
jgi:RND family efflux transporter MFP subunit